MWIFKKKINVQRANYKIVKQHISFNQQAVYRAVEELERPSTCRMVAMYLNYDASCVSPRLFELVKLGRLKISDRKKGLDGIWRKYYEVNR